MSHAPPAGARVTYQHQYRTCGKRGCAVCRQPNPGHGPYWYGYWRTDGRLYSYYIGKTLPEGLEREARRHRAASPRSPSSTTTPTSARDRVNQRGATPHVATAATAAAD